MLPLYDPFIKTLIINLDFFSLGLKEEEIARILEDRDFESGCLSDPVCPNSQKYRTIDGSCNNRDTKLKNLGRAVSGYRRLLKPAYDDGIGNNYSR